MKRLKKLSIRIKILIPFAVAMLIMAIASIYLSMGFISQSIEDRLMAEYDKKSHFFSDHISKQSHLLDTYSRILLRSMAAGRSGVSIPPKLLTEKDHLKIYTRIQELSPTQLQRYRSLISQAIPGTYQITPLVYSTGKNTYEAVLLSVIQASGKSESGPVIIELPLTYSSLSSGLDANYIEHIGLIYVNSKSKPIIVAASDFIASSSHLQNQVFSHLIAMHSRNKSHFAGSIFVDGEPFNIILRRESLSLPFYSMVLVPLIAISDVVQNIVIGTFAFLAVLSVCLIAIYALIIRKITTSIDILTDVAQKVSKGDLSQQVFVSTTDEIGTLSTMFNHMIENLNKSSIVLTQEKMQSEAIVSSIAEGILVTDLNFELISANASAESLLGISLSKSIGAQLLPLIKQKAVTKALKSALSSDIYPLTQEVVMTSRTGVMTCMMTSTALTNDQGEKSGIVTVFRDITREREMDALRESFLRTVSHELRTPLTSIIGFLELVKDDNGLPIEKRKFLEIALDESIRLKELINDLLDLSRMEAGTMTLEYTTISCIDLLSNLVTSLSPLTKGKDLKLSLHVPDPTLSVSADSPKLRRVLLNLISNAIKFTPSGDITVSAEQRDADILFKVSDTGIGLMENEQEIIFEKFRQVDSSASRKYQGIGLGLSIVKELVELHHGKVWVESEYGKGSTFYFTIPVNSHES
jgi:PAS domain S-box-containing protein